MWFTVTEVSSWLGREPFQLLIHILGVFVFSVLVFLRLENYSPYLNEASWFAVFSPLFGACACDVYFAVIYAIRSFKISNSALERRKATYYFLFNFFSAATWMLTEYFICEKLNEGAGSSRHLMSCFLPLSLYGLALLCTIKSS